MEVHLRSLSKNLFVFDACNKYLGLEVGMRMTVIRSDKGLALISPIPILATTKLQLEQIGEVKFIIAPNVLHHSYIRQCSNTFPEALVFVPSNLQPLYSDVSNVQLIKESIFKECIPCLEALELKGLFTMTPRGSVYLEEFAFFHSESKTLVLTDSAFSFSRSNGIADRLVALFLGMRGALSPTILERIASRDRDLLRESVLQICRWPFSTIVVAHGPVLGETGPSEFLKAYKWTIKQS